MKVRELEFIYASTICASSHLNTVPLHDTPLQMEEERV